MARRIFVALPVPPSSIESLKVYTDSLSYPFFTFTKPENYHVTVSFFGQQEEQAIITIRTIIARIAENTEPFSLSFDQIAYAPPKKTPTMLWAQYLPSEEFTRLVRNIESAVRTNHPYPDKREGQTPLPHITLARCKQTDLPVVPQIELEDMFTTRIVLYESQLTPEGSKYSIIDEYPLKIPG